MDGFIASYGNVIRRLRLFKPMWADEGFVQVSVDWGEIGHGHYENGRWVFRPHKGTDLTAADIDIIEELMEKHCEAPKD